VPQRPPTEYLQGMLKQDFLQAGCTSCHPINSVKVLQVSRTRKQLGTQTEAVGFSKSIYGRYRSFCSHINMSTADETM